MDAAQRDASTRATGLFVIVNTAIAVVIGLGFIDDAFASAGARGRAFLAAAILGQAGALCLLAGLPLLGLSRFVPWPRSRASAALLGPLVFTLLHVFLYIDLVVYEMFRFHINGLAVNLLTTPGGFAAMRLSSFDAIVFGVTCVVAMAGLTALLVVLQARSAGCDARAARRPWVVLAAVVLSALAYDRSSFAYADLRGDTALTRLARPVPLYLPVTAKRAAARWLGIEVRPSPPSLHAAGGSALRYPVRPLVGEVPAVRPDIVWVVLDSWRRDALDQRVTPRIEAFSRDALVFDRHLATGNATRFGIFGMFYGLHGVYWHPVLAEGRGPVLVDRLLELGYRFKVITPSPLTFPEFRRTVFSRVQPQLVDELPGETLVERHVQTVETFETFAAEVGRERVAGAEGSDAPFFSFLFFDSTHAPYDFPDDHTPFEPYASEISYASRDLDSQREPILNRYRNAIHWLDLLTGRVIDALAAADLLDDAVVLITGDHGEEFGEHGLWGHNSAFTDEQIHVPLIVRLPGREPGVVGHTTSHQDLAPTFMELLGITSPASDYANGRSLFDPVGERRVVSCGWSECAWVFDEGYVVFGTSGGHSFDLEVLDRDYRLRADGADLLAGRSDDIAALAHDLGRFLAD